MTLISQKDCELLVTDGHVTGHRFRYVTQRYFKRICVSYVASIALCAAAVSGGIPGGISLPHWLVSALTANPANYVAKPKPVVAPPPPPPPPAPVQQQQQQVDVPAAPQPQQEQQQNQNQNQDVQPGQSVAHPIQLPAPPAQHHGIPGEEPFNTDMFTFHTPESWASNPPSQHERILEYMRQFKKAENIYNKAHHITPAPAAEQPADAQ